jgi:hypothetical protein
MRKLERLIEPGVVVPGKRALCEHRKGVPSKPRRRASRVEIGLQSRLSTQEPLARLCVFQAEPS